MTSMYCLLFLPLCCPLLSYIVRIFSFFILFLKTERIHPGFYRERKEAKRIMFLPCGWILSHQTPQNTPLTAGTHDPVEWTGWRLQTLASSTDFRQTIYPNTLHSYLLSLMWCHTEKWPDVSSEFNGGKQTRVKRSQGDFKPPTHVDTLDQCTFQFHLLLSSWVGSTVTRIRNVWSVQKKEQSA